jgi:hypothetical protein
MALDIILRDPTEPLNIMLTAPGAVTLAPVSFELTISRLNMAGIVSRLHELEASAGTTTTFRLPRAQE